MLTAMGDVTHILAAAEAGDGAAAEQLLPLVYEELRKLAAHKLTHEKPGQTLQATALVHEAYVRLVNVDEAQHWNSRGHFFAAAAEAMRRMLVEKARHKQRLRHGGGRQRLDLDSQLCITSNDDETLLAVNDALEQLAAGEPQAAEVVKLRYFAGLTIEETSAALNISVRTVNRHWTYARAWLYEQLN
jgi:RNA polymerase sigma factor (TIGR02999 family)